VSLPNSIRGYSLHRMNIIMGYVKQNTPSFFSKVCLSFIETLGNGGADKGVSFLNGSYSQERTTGAVREEMRD